MKRNKIIYWVTTGLVELAMLFGATMYLSKNPMITENFQKAGLPIYLVVFIGLAKLAGAIVLVIPNLKRVKEWAYAGFGFIFLGAMWVHISTGTPWIAPFVFLLLLVTSYWSLNRLQTGAS